MVWKRRSFVALLKKKMPHKHYLYKLHLQATKNEQISSQIHTIWIWRRPRTLLRPFSFGGPFMTRNTQKKDLRIRNLNKTWIQSMVGQNKTIITQEQKNRRMRKQDGFTYLSCFFLWWPSVWFYNKRSSRVLLSDAPTSFLCLVLQISKPAPFLCS